MKVANERREKPRINLKGTAFVFDTRGRHQVELRNLSAVGVLVELAQPPTKGDAVQIGICLDGRSWIELAGRVRRVIKRDTGFECAIDLRRSTAESREAIEAYVQRVTAALSMAKQKEMFAKRMAGAEQLPPKLTRDELIRQVLPGAVLPSGVTVSGPPIPVPRPAPSARAHTPKPPAPEPEKRTDKKLISLYRAAVEDLDRKR